MAWAYYETTCFVKPQPTDGYVPLYRAFDGNHHYYSIDEKDFNDTTTYSEISTV
jgi:hypothetical protein